jgi:hypothetical protein
MTMGELRALTAEVPDEMQVIVGSRDGYLHLRTAAIQPVHSSPNFLHINYYPDVPLDEDEQPDINMLTLN